MDKVPVFLIALAFVICAVLGVYWCIWSLWCWVLPQLWPDGPQQLVAPGFWLFAACLFLVSWIGRAIFGGRATKAT